MTNIPFNTDRERNSQARAAAIAGTRKLMQEDEFEALVGLLLERRVCTPTETAEMLDRLADRLILKARGILETEYEVYPAELFDRARKLSEHASLCRRSVR